MEQTGTLKMETTFSFSELRKKVVDISEKKVFGFEKTRANLSLEQTINDYLKSPAEMDAEFSLAMHTGKLMIREHSDIFDTYGRLVEFRDGKNNTYCSDNTPSGFMEENY
ncbi:MAG: hypothetical protein ACXWWD_09570 [Chitinophagaceae bacterium]